MSTLSFKIKAKRCQFTAPHHQTTSLPTDIKCMFQSSLSDSLAKSNHDDFIESSWHAFKGAIQNASTMLPEVSSIRDPDRVTDELRNLSKKKSSAWLCYCNAAKRGYEVNQPRAEYKRRILKLQLTRPVMHG